ncbi:MAG: sigma-54-dependent Fis family transcriptional regulator [Candidatus Latescibacteria bacterium]|nr:sigma-54-dependent Fis family transcriptional regulator [Candidatus Latescibacterota bacterium]
MRHSARILVVDDEEDLRLGLAETLQGEGHQVETAGDGWGALEHARALRFDLALVDLKMPGPDGMVVLDQLKQLSPETLVVMITGHATVESAVAAMRLGAYDYLSKPFKLDQVRLVVRRAVEQKRLADENRRLRQEVEHYHRFEQIVGKSALMQELFRAIEKAAPTNSTVLICGETGTGKDLVARALHQRSPRAKGPLVSISCGAIPEALLESELFGHTKGAFTGAHADREGVFESAEGGTLFLDEIGDLPLPMQVKLLRALQERQIQRLGESRTRNVDVRLVSATHKDLRQEMQQGRFREDLYYRLDVLSVMVPPLRQRRDDIPLLVEHFLRKFNPEMGKALRGASPEAMAVLMRYDWPGNVRELQNAIERAVILQDGPQLQPEDFPLGRSGQPAPAAEPGGELVSLEEMERRHILWVLRQTDNHQSRAAQILRIGRRTLYRKIREYGLDLPEE